MVGGRVIPSFGPPARDKDLRFEMLYPLSPKTISSEGHRGHLAGADYKTPFPGQNIFELYRMRAEQLRRRTSSWVRLRAPAGIGSVQTFSGRHINVGPDGAIEMSAEDAQYYTRDGWTKLAEWTTEDAV
jgi:hypothetical protein